MPMWTSSYLQNSYSPVMEHLKFFHDHSMIVIWSLSTMFLFLLIFSIMNKNFDHFYLESQLMEFFWTFAPSLLLTFLALPSMKMLYLLEETLTPILTVKVTGYQWFWGYEYFDSNQKADKSFESNILKTNKSFKLLETSNNMLLPYGTPVRVLVTSSDVIHSWAMPALSTKMDAMPGRINQANIIVNRPGIMVGQCSEICGAGHSFMPIFVESLNFKHFLQSPPSDS